MKAILLTGTRQIRMVDFEQGAGFPKNRF